MWQYTNPDELYHYGVLGMKWGVRRYQNKDGSLTPAGKRHNKVNYTAEAKSMSTDDLRRSVNRMNMEKRYSELTRKTSRVERTANKVEKATDKANNANKSYRSINGDDSYSKIAGKGINGLSKTASAAKKIDKMVNRKSINLDHMSDKDLQDAISRLDLERQYSSLKKNKISNGKIYASEVIDIAGDVLAVSVSAVYIAKEINKLMGGRT